MNLISKAKAWLARVLGDRYPLVVQAVDQAATVFALTFLGKLVGSGFDVGQLTKLSYWETAAIAAGLAALSVLKSALAGLITGQPALLGFVSRTVRIQRDWLRRPRPKHAVSLRPPKDLP